MCADRFADEPLRAQQADRRAQPEGGEHRGGSHRGVRGKVGGERRGRVHERVEEARRADEQRADRHRAQRRVDGSRAHEAADKIELLLVESGAAQRGEGIGADEAGGLFSEADDEQH